MDGLFFHKENEPSTLNYIFQCTHQPTSIKMALESIISGWQFQSISDQLCAKEKYGDPLGRCLGFATPSPRIIGS